MRPRLVQGDGADAQRAFVQRRAAPGHDPHAQPGVDHEAQRVVAGDLDAQLQRQPGLRGGLGELVVDGAARVGAHKVVGQRLAQLHGLAPRQGVFRGDDQHQLIGAVRQQGHPVAVVAIVQDADVGRVLGHRIGNGRADLFLQPHIYLRVQRHEALQLGRQKLRDGRDVGHHPHMAAHAGAVFAHLAGNAVQIVEHAPRQVQQGKGGGRGGGAAVAAGEQVHAQGVFQVGQAAADGRCRQVFALCRGSDGAFFHHGYEKPQGHGIKFHGLPMVLPSDPAMPVCDGGFVHQRFAVRPPLRMMPANPNALIVCRRTTAWLCRPPHRPFHPAPLHCKACASLKWAS